MSQRPNKSSSAKPVNSISIVNEESKTSSQICQSVATVGQVLVLHLLNAANLEKLLAAALRLGAQVLDHCSEDEYFAGVDEEEPDSPKEW